MINEWVALGGMAAVRVLLAMVFRLSGLNDSLLTDPSADDPYQAHPSAPR